MDEDAQSDEWAGTVDPLSDPDERAHLYSVIDSFRQYRRHNLFHTTHVRRQAFYALPQAHWQLLAAPPISFLDTLCAVDDAIADNAAIAEAIYASAIESMGLTALANGSSSDKEPPWAGTATPTDHAKARSTIAQLFRDWSAEGFPERHASFAPVLADLAGLPTAPSPPARVLVPGAGLGRLVLELAAAGLAAEGSELSYHALLAGAWALNRAPPRAATLHPFAAAFGNVRARADQLRGVRVPDVAAAEVLAAMGARAGSMSMCAGDFCEVYGPGGGREAAFDAVATVFFVDTAPDVVRYVQTVRHSLRVGGLWSNVGPLLWHFEPPGEAGRAEGDNGADAPRRERIGSHGSVELAHDEVLALVQQFGFRVEKVETDGISTGYIGNERSMLESRYKPVHWLARRVS